MYQLFVQNAYDDEMELTHASGHQIISIEGFDPPDGIINTTRNAGYDGSVYNSAYMDSRTIIITLAINAPCEENRIKLYRYFKIKSKVRLRYRTAFRDVYIDGYVESMSVAYFEKKQRVQITVFCPDPALNGKENIVDFTDVVGTFEFPVTFDTPKSMSSSLAIDEINIYNAGDLATGSQINIEAMGTVVNPKIIDISTLGMIALNLTLASGDLVEIKTMQGQKGVWLNGQNAIGNLVPGVTWLEVRPGDNLMTITADSGKEQMRVSVILTEKYEGV